MSTETQQPPTRHLTEVEARFLATRDEILARRNPELLAREKAEFEAMSNDELQVLAARPEPKPLLSPAEARLVSRMARAREKAGFEAMTDAELAVIAGPAPMVEGFNESSFAGRYDADVTEATAACRSQDRPRTAAEASSAPSDENPVELWRRHQQAYALFNALREFNEEDEAAFYAVVDEIEKIATDQVPTTLEGVLLRLRLIQHNQETIEWGEFEDKLIARAIEGLEAMATAGEPSAGG